MNVGFFQGIPGNIDQRVDQDGGIVLRKVPEIRLVVTKVKDGVAQQTFIDRMRLYADVEYAVPDVYLNPHFIPTDEYYGRQWGPQRIGAEAAWNSGLGSRAVRVAVIDTGVFCLHEDLAGVCDPLSPSQVDGSNHGTFVSGIIAGLVNNDNDGDGKGEGIAGLSQSTIYSVGIAEPVTSYLLLSEAAAALVLAADPHVGGADIISMSWGVPSLIDCRLTQQAHCLPLQNSVLYAYQFDVLLVASAGNDFCQSVTFPAAYPEVVAVAASDTNNNRWPFGNCGPEMDLIAPGAFITSTIPANSLGCDRSFGDLFYCDTSGTSAAAPHVSGSAALVVGACPGLNRDQVRTILENTAVPLAGLTPDEQGRGMVRADLAVDQALAHPSCAPG